MTGHRWAFINRSDYDRFLTALVETDGAGGIAGYRLDEGVGMVRVHIRHRLSNLFRPAMRAGITEVLQDTIDYGKTAGVRVDVVGSCMPCWTRRGYWS